MGGKIYSEVLGDAPFLQAAVTHYVEQMPGRIQEMEQALVQGALDQLKALAHRLKGTGGMHGYPEITARARELEAACAAGDLAAARAGLDAITELAGAMVAEPAPPAA